MMYLVKILLKYSTTNNKIKLNILMIQVILYANHHFSCWSLFGKNFSCDLQHNEAIHVHQLAMISMLEMQSLGFDKFTKGKIWENVPIIDFRQYDQTLEAIK